MKTFTRVLVFIALGLMPLLAIAGPGSAPASAGPLGELDANAPASYGMCSEASPADVVLDLQGQQDCASDTATPLGLADNAAPVSMERKPCKACQQQPWCACTYQGHPRVSCDPCCYQTYAGQICTS